MNSPDVAELTDVAVGKPGDPCTMVIFGAAGDLTRRKLLPALYNLATDNLLSREFAIVGLAREQMSTEQFREKFTQDIKQFATGALSEDLTDWFARRLHYVSGEFGDPTSYAKLKEILQHTDKEHGTRGNYLYYLATAPMFFSSIPQQLKAANLAGRRKWAMATRNCGEAIWPGPRIRMRPECRPSSSIAREPDL